MIGKAAGDHPHFLRPVPRRPQRDDFFLDGGRTQPFAAHALRLGTAVNVALQVGQLQLADREPLAKGGDQVLEVQLDPLDGAIFERIPVRRKVAVAETGEREFPRFGGYFLQVGRRLAVVLDELDDIDAGRQFDQPLLKPHQQVINLGCFARGFLSGHLAEGEQLLFAVTAEMEAVASAPLLKCSHRCVSNVTATLFPNCSHWANRQVAICRKSILPKVGLEPTPSCEDRILSPVRLPFPWYWKHVGVTLKVSRFKAVTIPPLPTYIIAALG